MRDPDANRDIDRQMAALFATAGTPPEADGPFVAGVLKQIRRRERMRWWILGGSALIACVFALPAAWELVAAWGLPAARELPAAWSGVDASLLDGLGARLDQGLSAIADLLRAAAQSVAVLTAAALAATIFPLLRWLAD